MTKFKENIGKQVFMVVEDKHNKHLVTFHQKPEDVVSFFNSYVAGKISEMSLHHGTLTKAISIPDTISSTIDITVVVRLNTSNSCALITCVSLEYAQGVVRALAGAAVDADDIYSDEIIEDTVSIRRRDIEDIYIFYGYEVELHYTFDKSELDDEILEGSKEIYDQIKSTQYD